MSGAPGRPSNSTRSKRPKQAARARGVSQFMQPQQPDAILGAIVGDHPMPRTDITKKLWAYIKKQNLQGEAGRRNIYADAKMQALFGGKKKVSMFNMTKLVNKHLKPAATKGGHR